MLCGATPGSSLVAMSNVWPIFGCGTSALAGLQADKHVPKVSCKDNSWLGSERFLMQASGPWGARASTDLLASARADVDEVSEWVAVDYSRAMSQVLAFLPEQVLPPMPTAWYTSTELQRDDTTTRRGT